MHIVSDVDYLHDVSNPVFSVKVEDYVNLSPAENFTQGPVVQS